MLTVIDCETTGLTAGIHEVCQVSFILINDNLEQVAKFTSLVRPRRLGLIDADAMAVHGISMEDLLAAPTSEEVRGAFLEWWNDLGQNRVYPCGWNYQFDRDFLRMFFGQVEYESLFYYKAVDVYSIAYAAQCGGRISASNTLSLADVTEELAITHMPHDAFSDTWATWKILERLIK